MLTESDKDPYSGTVDTVAILLDDVLRPRHTYPADYVHPESRSSPPPQMTPLPDGRKVFRPKIDALDTTAFEDWVAHTAPVAAPRDLTSRLRIE